MASRVEANIDDARKNRIHPWDEWTDGETWQAIRGQDYNLARSFQTILYREAKDRGMKVKIRVLDEGEKILFQFSEK